MSLLTELSTLRKTIAGKKAEYDRTKGREQTLLEGLKQKTGYATLEEAEQALPQLKNEAATAHAEFHTKKEEALEKYQWN